MSSSYDNTMSMSSGEVLIEFGKDGDRASATGSTHSTRSPTIADGTCVLVGDNINGNNKSIYKKSNCSSNGDNEDENIDDDDSFGSEDGSDNDDDDDDSDNGTKETLGNVREAIQLVGIARVMLILTILTFAFVSAESVFLTTVNHEDENLKVAYNDVSNELIESFFTRVENIISISQTFATEITESTRDRVTQQWPFVTLSNFQERCSGPLRMGHGSMITFSPKVSQTQLIEWEDYAELMLLNSSSEGNTILLDDDSVSYYSTGKTITDGVYKFSNGTSESIAFIDGTFGYAVPIWQLSPTPAVSSSQDTTTRSTTRELVGTLFDEASNSVRSKALQAILTNVTTTGGTNGTDYPVSSATSSFLYEDTDQSDLAYFSVPWTNLYTPIFSPSSSNVVVGVINYQFKWEDAIFQDVLEDSYTQGELVIVLQNQCTDVQFSYSVTGPVATFMGIGDLHDKKVNIYTPIRNTTYADFDSLFVPATSDQSANSVSSFSSSTTGTSSSTMNDTDAGSCPYRMTVYASSSFQSIYKTNRPLLYRGIVLVALFFLMVTFGIFDWVVQSQAKNFVEAAKDSDAIVRSLFPDDVADRLYKKKRDQRRNGTKKGSGMKGSFVATRKNRLSSLLRSSSESGDDLDDRRGDVDDDDDDEPLADVYPSATVIFADMAGFTSWSSERDPSQVFTLLEKIYSSMDRTAKKYGVFKVETIGDCYVAATGVPEGREDHAVAMCNFSRSCLVRSNALFKSLVSEFGPGTDFLQFRFGINSGPVTAGVLRGQKCRFQLFGDAINTASRMESTGIKGRIHLSLSTAELLIAAGKESWITPREEMIEAKGKGLMQTYWLMLGRSSSVGSSQNGSISVENVDDFGNDKWGGSHLAGIIGQTRMSPPLMRLIDWNTDVFLDRLKAINNRRTKNSDRVSADIETQILCGDNIIPSKEVKMSIPIPEFDAEMEEKASNRPNSRLKAVVESELKEFITAVASGYPKNPFHNFEHASHVVLAAAKLLKRIMSADEHVATKEGKLTSQDLYEHTFGIAYDPLAQFAVVFSCLCHDLDHPGVPNGHLMKESPELANKYEFRSVAEQHSLDIAFKLLLLPQFSNLRRAIYVTEDECRRFRQLCINLILATDIMDKDLNNMRNVRWSLCFNKDDELEHSDISEVRNRKATIVLELIIQASDVAHTYQHWAVYTKWNECLFQEMYFAYLDGRSENDPTENWYKGEISFFKNYIVPFAMKLKDCWSVFGICHSEFLNNAISNRQEWEMKGKDVVARMKSSAVQMSDKRTYSKKTHTGTGKSEPKRSIEKNECSGKEQSQLNDTAVVQNYKDKTVADLITASTPIQQPKQEIVKPTFEEVDVQSLISMNFQPSYIKSAYIEI